MQDRLQHWLNARGISDSTIESFNLSDTNHYLLGEETLVIPVNHPDGEFSFNKYRRSPFGVQEGAKYMYDKGSRTQLFGADKLESLPDVDVVITEGELDTLVLHSMNIYSVSSTGGAMSFQEEWVGLLDDCNVFICYDNDDAGAKGAVRTLEMLPNAKVIFIPEQPDVKDISDFVAKGGDFQNLMRSARSYSNAEEVAEDMAQRRAQWLPTRFHKAYLANEKAKEAKAKRGTRLGNYAGNDKRLKAKDVSCEKIIDFVRGKACCPKHNEKTPSLHYYKKSNSAYCFGCSESFDSIELYRAVHGCDFKTAVNELNKM